MSEQRLVTYHGGPLDGRTEVWEAGQVHRDCVRGYPLQVRTGRYVGTLDGGDAEYEPSAPPPDPQRNVPSSNRVLGAEPRCRRERPSFWQRLNKWGRDA